MKNKKLLTAVALSAFAITSTMADHADVTDTTSLDGTIGEAITATVGGDIALNMSVGDSDPDTQTLTINANVPFYITLSNANQASHISTSEGQNSSGGDTIAYTIVLSGVGGSGSLLTSFGTPSTVQNEVASGSYTLSVDLDTITAATDAGTYSDTITATITDE